MAKNRRRRGANRGQRQSQPSQRQRAQTQAPKPAPLEADPAAEIKKAHGEAVDVSTNEALDALTNEPAPSEIDLNELWKMARDARDLYRAAEQRHEAELKEVQLERKSVDEKMAHVNERASTLDAHERDFDDRASQLHDREVQIREREADAERGFEGKRTELIAKYDDAIAERREALDKREQQLDGREQEMARKATELRSKEKQLRWDEEDIKEREGDLENRLQQRLASEQETYKGRLGAVEAERDQARRDRDQHAEALRQREEADRRFGQRSPEKVLSHLDELMKRNHKLERQLAARPDPDAITRLDALDKERQLWQSERLDLTRQVSELKRHLAYADNDAGERETQRDRIASLESQADVLRRANEELRTEVQELVGRHESESPFPACIAMDEDSELRRKGQTLDDLGSLKEFAEDVRNRIGNEGLYYTEADIRSFIGGLAMGRLTLLQGISGTGKTSLPCKFAQAVGTWASVIEVQAGWRDPQDLVGHYNAFEKRFYEKEFLQALYRAGTPLWRDTIQIVLLDEMNLSIPEQYFSDMLSALELEERQIVLMTHPTAQAPKRFKERRRLPIPPNVWFVGTANHDETTMDFAGKTYDRAHVMEFPDRPTPFKAPKPEPRHPVSFEAFSRLVESARTDHAKEAQRVQEYLEERVRSPLAEHFEIRWGPRLERQMQCYVPVVVAAGGSVGEAADHLLSMRLLGKLKRRHNNRPEHIEQLKQAIKDSWLEQQDAPAKSMQVLDYELRRTGHDPV